MLFPELNSLEVAICRGQTRNNKCACKPSYPIPYNHFLILHSMLALLTALGADTVQDELEAELEDLEGAELEEQLLQPSTTQLPPVPSYSRPTTVPAKKPAQNKEEEDELAALQAEMALE